MCIRDRCNEGDGNDGGELPDDDETVSLNEFIEIFTEDHATIERLKDIIQADDAVAKVDGVIVNWIRETIGRKKSTNEQGIPSRDHKLTKMRSKNSRNDSDAKVALESVTFKASPAP